MKNYHNIEIDIKDLQTHYRETPLFRSLIDFFGGQEESEDDSQITVRELAKRMTDAGLKINYNDARRMLQSLEGKECGWFTIGRHGHATRFDFDVSITSLAKTITGKNPMIPMMPTVKTITHKFHLRPDREVSFDLPEDLTDKEVCRIADFLKTLPFERADSVAAA